jgi:hypothetical protein
MKGAASPLAALITKQRAAVSAAATAGNGAERRRLAKTADTLTKHLARWVPDDISDAVRLLAMGRGETAAGAHQIGRRRLARHRQR